MNIDLYMPRNQKQIDETIRIIKEKNERIFQKEKNK